MNQVLFYEELCLALQIWLLVCFWELFKMLLRRTKVAAVSIVRYSKITMPSLANGNSTNVNEPNDHNLKQKFVNKLMDFVL